ncbi:MAG: TatD family hydrolase, partial [Chloroflexota bacterium]
MLIDTHCHLDFDGFDTDRDEVVARAAGAGVTRIIVPAIDLDNSRQVIALAEKYDGVYAAVGVHPNSSAAWQDHWLDTLCDLAQHAKVVAIGEIGLDYYRDRSPRPVQHQAFQAQLALAVELGLPVIVHNREAGQDVLRLLRESPLTADRRPPTVGEQPSPIIIHHSSFIIPPRIGVLHSFAADWPTAEAALALGLYLGFTGPITYKNADELRQIAGRVPLERLLIETDA